MPKRKTKSRPFITGSMLNVGHSPEAIAIARNAIVEILKCDATDGPKIAALNCLHTMCSVNNTTISNCTFTSGA